jgi:hypothetical protein
MSGLRRGSSAFEYEVGARSAADQSGKHHEKDSANPDHARCHQQNLLA